jgi:hypothetical protein
LELKKSDVIGESMNFKKLTLLFLGFFSVFSAYSFGSFFQGDCESKNGEQPMFEYKAFGFMTGSLSRKAVERRMSQYFWACPILFVVGCGFFALKKLRFSQRRIIIVISAFLLPFGGIMHLEMKRFQSQAGPWLKALKEKEQSLKGEN